MLDEQKDDEESASRLSSVPGFTSPYDTNEFQEYLVPDAPPVLPVPSVSGPAQTSNTTVSPRPLSSRQVSSLPKKGDRGKSVLLTVLVLLLVASVGGGFLFYASHLHSQPVPTQNDSLPSSPQALFKAVTGRKPVLYDLLTNGATSSWPTSMDNANTQCTFEADGYHVQIPCNIPFTTACPQEVTTRI